MVGLYNEWSPQTIFNDKEKVCHVMLCRKHEHIEYYLILVKYILNQYIYKDIYFKKSQVYVK